MRTLLGRSLIALGAVLATLVVTVPQTAPAQTAGREGASERRMGFDRNGEARTPRAERRTARQNAEDRSDRRQATRDFSRSSAGDKAAERKERRKACTEARKAEREGRRGTRAEKADLREKRVEACKPKTSNAETRREKRDERRAISGR